MFLRHGGRIRARGARNAILLAMLGWPIAATAACPIEPSAALGRPVECAELPITLDPNRPNARGGSMAYAVVHALHPDASRPPLLFLMGGNGAGVALIAHQPEMLARLTRRRDLILVDHRGAGFSRPAVACAGFADSSDIPSAPPAVVRRCGEALRAAGVDVNLFSPARAAEDIRELRRALGIARWDVYAVSFGTRIAKGLFALDADAVHSAVLDGVYGWNTNSFSRADLLDPVIGLLDACSAEPECHRTYPALEAQLAAVLLELRRRPKTIDTTSIGPVDFMNSIQDALGIDAARRLIPLAIGRATAQQFDVWQELSVAAADERQPAATPAVADFESLVFYGTLCREEYLWRKTPVDVPAPTRRLASVIDVSTQLTPVALPGDIKSFCQLLGYRPAARAGLRSSVIRVPTLILTGEIDTNTPAAAAARALSYLPNGHQIIFPATPHWVLRRHLGCAASLIDAFQADPSSTLDRACVDALPRLNFATARSVAVAWSDGPLDVDQIEATGVVVSAQTYQGRKALRVEHASGSDGQSFAVVPHTLFQDGTIEVDVAGDIQPNTRDSGARGFVGIAFRISPNHAYEAFYLRPLNGRSLDQEQRNHAAQYISMPENPWQTLRSESPGRYEAYVDLTPGTWTHLRIEVQGTRAQLYVGAAPQPVLIVPALLHGVSTGDLGLWVDYGSVAYFTDLKVTPR